MAAQNGLSYAPLLGAAVFCIMAGCPGSEPEAPEQPPLKASATGGFKRSSACKRCHVDIHRYWNTSTHATSYRNRNFQVALRQYDDEMAKRGGKAEESVCLPCHAPMMVYGGKSGKRMQLLADEGVGCDFCHSVTDVNLDQPDRPYVVDDGPKQRGPVKNASSAKHPVEYLALFEESRFCAGCHEYTSKTGLSIISTFSEWEAAKGGEKEESCQQCHMPVDSGSIVDPQIKRSTKPMNTHKMPGSHSRAQLRKALVLRIESLRQDGKDVVAVVAVDNRGAGHHIPTGMPTRKLILRVEATTSSGKAFEEERVYQKRLLNAAGAQIQSDSAAFSDAVTMGDDNRIAARERRRETMRFPISHDEKVTVKATLDYSYSPQPGDLPEERLSIVSIDKSLAAR